MKKKGGGEKLWYWRRSEEIRASWNMRVKKVKARMGKKKAAECNVEACLIRKPSKRRKKKKSCEDHPRER